MAVLRVQENIKKADGTYDVVHKETEAGLVLFNDAEIKADPEQGDYIPVIDSSDNGKTKKFQAKVLTDVADVIKRGEFIASRIESDNTKTSMNIIGAESLQYGINVSNSGGGGINLYGGKGGLNFVSDGVEADQSDKISAFIGGSGASKGAITLYGGINGGNPVPIINVADPVGQLGATNKRYVDNAIQNAPYLNEEKSDGRYLKLSGGEMQIPDLSHFIISKEGIDILSKGGNPAGFSSWDENANGISLLPDFVELNSQQGNYISLTEDALTLNSFSLYSSLDGETVIEAPGSITFKVSNQDGAPVKLSGVAIPVEDNDAVNKKYADDHYLSLSVGGTIVSQNKELEIAPDIIGFRGENYNTSFCENGAMFCVGNTTLDIFVDDKKAYIRGLTTPEQDSDAANKKYVDANKGIPEAEADGRYLLREDLNDVSDAFGIIIKPNPEDPNEDVIFDFMGFSSGGIGSWGGRQSASLSFGEFTMDADEHPNLKTLRLFYNGDNSFCFQLSKTTSLQLKDVEILGLPTPSDDSSPTPKSYVDGLVGNINTVLDQINGEVV